MNIFAYVVVLFAHINNLWRYLLEEELPFVDYPPFTRHLGALLMYFLMQEEEERRENVKQRGVLGWALQELHLMETLLNQVFRYEAENFNVAV